MLRFLRNLTADAILIIGLTTLAILAIPLLLIEVVVHHSGGWLILAVIVGLLFMKRWRK